MRARRRTWLTLGLLGLLLVAVSPAFGRADPQGSYRPEVPEDALTNGCWPLPGDAVLDLAYQVRTDDSPVTIDGKPRRVLRLHYDLLDEAAARAAVVASFERAGFTVTEPTGPSGSYDVSLVGSGGGERVDLTVTAFEGLDDPADAAVVRGLATIVLPPSEPSDDPACAPPSVTKRFAPDAEPST